MHSLWMMYASESEKTKLSDYCSRFLMLLHTQLSDQESMPVMMPEHQPSSAPTSTKGARQTIKMASISLGILDARGPHLTSDLDNNCDCKMPTYLTPRPWRWTVYAG